ncbi:hypothetical protein [Nesterenkonia sp.]|uniref:hypothetical protein n=1 Tax=Nesterenkonia sp. TaxID=704201 RepID=UPI00261DE484|nr:hypothetical protein [Nesterenkonia sp.]
MSRRIPDEVRDAIQAELEADTEEYRETLGEGEWGKPNAGPSPILTLRLPAETLESLRALAASNGVAVSTLVRGFIADGLADHQEDDLPTALARLERDLAAVKARALAT